MVGHPIPTARLIDRPAGCSTDRVFDDRPTDRPTGCSTDRVFGRGFNTSDRRPAAGTTALLHGGRATLRATPPYACALGALGVLGVLGRRGGGGEGRGCGRWAVDGCGLTDDDESTKVDGRTATMDG